MSGVQKWIFIRDSALRVIDVVASPAVYIAGSLLKLVRRIGVTRLPVSKRALLAAGVFPIRDHYYEPLFKPNGQDFSALRSLPGIQWNREGQIAFLDSLKVYVPEFQLELANNSMFGSGDAEVWFATIRHFKPKRIIEVGSGYSTRVARSALDFNLQEGYRAEHVCIEPYETPWLEKCGATVIRKRVEDVDRPLFESLSRNDILFVDSSHVIRPRGDVVTEILEILPQLGSGVVVHFHDIFSPHDYPVTWLFDEVRFWNEQYLLEAFLTNNSAWSVLAALNYLQHTAHESLAAVCRCLASEREPGSFYIRRN